MECVVCMDTETFGAIVQCSTCNSGNICIDCVEGMTPNMVLNCPCCRSKINHYNVKTIFSLFCDSLTRKPITNPLYERLYSHYKDTEIYELIDSCY